jgi:serine/threonine protein kinase
LSRTPEQDVAAPDLPGYRFIKHIGAGGNAQVYLYEQNLPHRKVAVKVLNESALSDAARRRFTAEANVTADLAHRHIVQVFDANVTTAGRPYIVMPYYPQPNLSVRARRSHFSVADVLRIGIQIGSAVETSHRRDVLHRDIKPQNILSDSYGEPALTDFGIATTKGGDGPEGLSVPWSPPEILYGTSPGDQRADVYSLGATLWHLLVGRSPFELPGGDNGTFALMGRIKSDPPPRTQRADVPDSLERLLRQAMAKDPAARPQSAMELIRGLQSVEQELRLPLTHPILPADEPSGYTRGGDTIARPLARGGDNTFSGRGPASGLTDRPAARGATDAAREPGARYADPRTQGGQLPRAQTQGGQAPAGQAQSRQAQSGQPPWDQTVPPWNVAPDPQTGAPVAWSGGADLRSDDAPAAWSGGADPRIDDAPAAWRGGADPRIDDAPAAWRGGAEPRADGAPPVWSGGADLRSDGAPVAWSGGADLRSDGAPAVWSGGTHEPTVARGTRPAVPEEDVTRWRAPMRLDPRGQADQVEDDPTRTRGPVRLDPWGAAGPSTGAGFPEFEPAGREGTTTARPAALRPGSHAAGRTPGVRPSGRVLVLAGGVLVAVVAAVAFFTLGSRGPGRPTSNPTGVGQSTASGSEQNALGPGATAPGQPAVTAHRAGGTQVRFSWTYANPAAGDTFRWQRVSGTAGTPGGVTTKPEVLVSLPQGQSVCVVVQVRRSGGQASDPSQPVCWPS